ncbi:MAG: sortase [Oscillospiraceae bacterium]|nr:sortase [Oscillospiraceae bacterium]
MRKGGAVLMALGGVLILAALALLLYNRWDNARAGSAAQTVLEALQEESADSDVDLPIYNQPTDGGMDTVTLDGYSYIGTLTIPALELELPVMDQWSYPGLKIAPGRYAGSVWTDDLVICGHNYQRHFGTLKYLEPGDALSFTDVNGTVFHYEVGEVVVLQPTQIEDMMESGWDLTLFTCTTDGRTRVTVRCVSTNP